MNENIIQAQFVDLTGRDPIPYRDSSNNYNSWDYIPFGSDNLFPQSLAMFCRLSPNHRGIINSKHLYIMGDGVISENEVTNTVLSAINYKQENITDVLSRVLLDDLMFGNGFIELITDKNRSFLYVNQLDSTKCRMAKNKEEIIIHPDWRNYKGKTDKYRKTLPLYPNFEKDTENEDGFPAYRSVYHIKRYVPEFVYYGLPDYIAAKDSIQIDFKTNKWNLSRLKNSFRVSGIMVVPVKDSTESKEVLDYINRNFIGEEKQARLLTITKSRALDNEKADQTQFIETKQDDEGSWIDLHKQSTGDMVVAHRWYRSLVGLADNTGFDTSRILNEYEIALNTTITIYQKQYLDVLKRVWNQVLNQELDVQWQNRPPFDNDKYNRIWELRKEKGLEYDENSEAEQEIIK